MIYLYSINTLYSDTKLSIFPLINEPISLHDMGFFQ